MSVVPIPGEHLRYFVASGSRPIQHVVDLQYQGEPWNKPKAMCSCERVFCGHEVVCKHILSVILSESQRLGLEQKAYA